MYSAYHIKRVLDNGAHGVVVPMVNTREEAEALYDKTVAALDEEAAKARLL